MKISELKRTKREFWGKVKVSFYVSRKSAERLMSMAAANNKQPHEEILNLLNDGLRYRKERK